MGDMVSVISIGALVLLVIFTVTWIVQLRTRNASIVDTVWSVSFPVSAMVYFILIDGYAPRQLLVLALVSLWGFRLGAYLYARTIGKPEDVRYAALRKEWGESQNIRMLRFYYFQALMAALLSFPFALLMLNTTPTINGYELLGVVVWFIALVGESLADSQLSRFKRNPANQGKICDQGLWYYSRHPNYFFEWMIWVAFFIMSLGSYGGFVTILCPIAMYYFLTMVTGIPYTEKLMAQSKGEAFVKYRQTTSAFFPLPKRRP